MRSTRNPQRAKSLPFRETIQRMRVLSWRSGRRHFGGRTKNGRVVDVNNALNGDGPFSPERTGGLPCISLIELCFSGRFTLDEMKKKIAGKGGLVAYRGSNSCIDLENAVKSGDKNAELLYKAMIYQISKEIAMHGATLKGKVDCVVLTGGMAKDKTLTDKITDRIGYLAPVKVIPGEREMTSLAAGVLRVLDGLETAKEYHT